MKNPNIPCPTKSEVEKYLAKWEKDDDLKETEKNLVRLFQETYPKNDDVYEIWIKVQTLNSAFNVNVPEIHKVANHILRLSKNGTLTIEEIRIGHGAQRRGATRESNLYSFATKYYSFSHQREHPIFDSNVETALKYFRDKCGKEFSFNFGNNDLRVYTRFVKVIENFQKVFDLKKYSFREINPVAH